MSHIFVLQQRYHEIALLDVYFFQIFLQRHAPYRSLLLNGFLDISGNATGFIARQVNGETWVQTLHLNGEQAQISGYVYIFRGYSIYSTTPKSWQCKLTKNPFDYSMICTFPVFCQIFFVT